MRQFHQVLSAPIPVRFQGWMSTTFDLQKAGWELSLNEFQGMSGYQKNYELLIRNKALRLVGLSRVNSWNFSGFTYNGMHDGFLDPSKEMAAFEIDQVAADVIFQTVGVGYRDYMKHAEFMPIDATPELRTFTSDRFSLQELALFKKVDHSKDIIVDPRSIEEIMDHILKMQSPKQKEIREKARAEADREAVRRQLAPETMIHAQLVSLVA